MPVRMVRIPPRFLRVLADVCPERLSCRLLALSPASSANAAADCERSGSMTVTIPTISAGPMQIATRVPPHRAPEDTYGASKIPTIEVRRDRPHHIALTVVASSANCARVYPARAISIASCRIAASPDEPLHVTRHSAGQPPTPATGPDRPRSDKTPDCHYFGALPCSSGRAHCGAALLRVLQPHAEKRENDRCQIRHPCSSVPFLCLLRWRLRPRSTTSTS